MALAAGIAPAQTPPDQDLMAMSIEDLARVKVYSASRHLEDSREAPSAVTVITAEEITRYGWRTLADVLRSVRGFYTAYDRDYAYLGVRGFLRSGDYNSRILLLINGHRVNDNVYGSAPIGTEFPLDLDLVDHIEIVRGPGSSLFGTNAVFGIVNVITRHPKADTVEASGDASSFFGRTGRVTTTFEKGKLSALFSGSIHRTPGESRLFFPEFATPETNNGVAENIDGDRYEHVFADVQYGNFRIQGLFSNRTKLIPTASYGTIFNDPANRTRDTGGYVDVSYHRSMSAQTDLDLRIYYDAYDFLGTGDFAGVDPLDKALGVTTGHNDMLGTEATLGRQIGRHRITLGAQYEYSVDVSQSVYVVGGPQIFAASQTPWLAAVYGEAELNLLPKVTLHAGGRLDSFSTFGSTFSPRIAVIYSPNSRTALKYIFGRAFRAPNAYEEYYFDSVVIGEPALNLRPEEIQSHEVVLERSLNPWLSVTAEGYYNTLRDLIDQVPDPATGMTHFVNSGRNRGRGIELELAAKRASGLSARASYTYSDARNTILQTRLANSPLNQAKLNATLPLTKRGFAGMELLYFSAQQSYQETRVPASFLTNFTLSTKPLWEHWEFSLSCYNMFDRRWSTPAGPENLQDQIQQDGRTYRFKLSYRLPIKREQGKK
jgi:iron complex outermembrane receptor protein